MSRAPRSSVSSYFNYPVLSIYIQIKTPHIGSGVRGYENWREPSGKRKWRGSAGSDPLWSRMKHLQIRRGVFAGSRGMLLPVVLVKRPSVSNIHPLAAHGARRITEARRQDNGIIRQGRLFGIKKILPQRCIANIRKLRGLHRSFLRPIDFSAPSHEKTVQKLCRPIYHG